MTAVRLHPLEHRVPPPVVTLITAVAMGALSVVTPHIGVGGAARWRVGTLLAITGIALATGGFLSFRRASTTLNPVQIDEASKLVSQGPFRLSRNPMYVGMALLLVGVAAWLASPAALLGPIAFTLFITRFQIVPEERAMLAKFGSEYERYQATTRRWL